MDPSSAWMVPPQPGRRRQTGEYPGSGPNEPVANGDPAPITGHQELDPPEESADQEARNPPLDTLWSARKTTASWLEPDWMLPGELVPQYWPMMGEPGEPPLKIVSESQVHVECCSRLK